jgi:DNA (cytosine-5)-methyltransferase 1
LAIPIIDIFAGPGGLGEGFCALQNEKDERVFKIVLSIEKDEHAHQTLTLRSFFRQFNPGKVPPDYYEFVKGNIELEDLYKKWPLQAASARNEAWRANLGNKKRSMSHDMVDERIRTSLRGQRDWLLIGGPPCQAYSVIGRVRKKRKTLNEKRDERVGLYKQYLRILALHSPSVFIMENVKGLLTAKTKESPVFEKILKDLADPVSAFHADFKENGQKLTCPGYEIYSLVRERKKSKTNEECALLPKDYLIKAEDYGIPQTRHRVILLGVRRDINQVPSILKKDKTVSISRVISGLPRIRSRVSRSKDDAQKWKAAVLCIADNGELNGCDRKVKDQIKKQIGLVTLPHLGIGKNYISDKDQTVDYRKDWYIDKQLKGVCNHIARSHMKTDLHRYMFLACFAKTTKRSPTLEDFPVGLLPNHKNVREDDGGITRTFADRFKVQLKGEPSKTITSHISQDGHYYIHYDPTQCRSFTVREAARVQTFPDNYFFCGTRTSQYIQVGNAVPPLLANKIALVVMKLFNNIGNASH